MMEQRCKKILGDREDLENRFNGMFGQKDASNGNECTFFAEQMTKFDQEVEGDFASYAALDCIADHIIVQDKIYFPDVGDWGKGSKEQNVIDILGSNHQVSTPLVSDWIHKWLIGKKFFSQSDPTKYFILKRNVPSDGSLCCVRVFHKPMDHPKKYFKKNFLTPYDEILQMIPSTKMSADGRMSAYVILDLGTDVIHPTKLIAGRIQDNIRYEMEKLSINETFININKQIEMLTQSIEDPGPQEDGKRQKLLFEKLRDNRVTQFSRVKSRLDYISKIHPKKYFPDKHCHTIAHSFKNQTN